MNTIISCIIGMSGGAFGGAMLTLVLWHGVVDPIIFPSKQPRDKSTIGNATRYSLLCGAVIGLILVLGSGQRL